MIVNSDRYASIYSSEEGTFRVKGQFRSMWNSHDDRQDSKMPALRARDVIVLISRCTGKRNGKCVWLGYRHGQKETKRGIRRRLCRKRT